MTVQRRVATAAAALGATLCIAAFWIGIWYILAVVVMFVTWAPDAEPAWTRVYVPVATIPILYLPFLTRVLVIRWTGDRRLAQTAMFVAIAAAVAFTFWLEWWYTHSTR